MTVVTRAVISDTNIHIINSYQIESPVLMRSALMDLKEEYPDNSVLKERSIQSMVNEWVGHNNLYKLHLFKSQTKHVDLQIPVKWYEPIVYWLLSRVVL